MNDLDAALVETALRDMFSRNSFSICTIDEIAKLTKAVPDAEAYKRLRLLHCVAYSAMPPAVRDALPGLIRDVLGGPAIDVEAMFRPGPARQLNTIDVTGTDSTDQQPRKTGLLRLFKS